ncbi:MAG TPA: ABC transporter ATP-binding protein [Candidatus Angelobacter sp.]|nr:ABC transporter ATP-binding protein [Candidatus Angelobacter sp.]
MAGNKQISHDLTLSRLCRWAMGYALRRPAPLATVVTSLLLKIGLDLLKPWPTVFLIDYVLRGKTMSPALEKFIRLLPGPSTPDALIGWSVAATVLIFLLSWLVDLAATYANISLAQRMTYDLAADLFAKMQQLSLHFHARKSVGDNIRRVTADCASASTIVKDALLPVGSAGVTLGAMFSILWHLDPTLSLLSLLVVPYMMFVFWKFARPMMERSYAQQETEGKIYDIIEQTFSSIQIVQAFGRDDLNRQQFCRATQDSLAATLSLTRAQMQFKILIGLATAAGTAVIIWIGAQHALAGAMSLGTIIAFLSYLGSLYTPLESIMYTGSTIQGAAGSARRVLEVLQTDNLVEDRPGAISPETVQGQVRFESVTFGYLPDRPVLRDISFEVAPGQTLALVGETGAGKSTLASLIPRFFDPTSGRVLLDGHDLRELRLKTLRSNVALVLQEPFLFPISIAENIAYGSPHATLQQIEAAARAANAHEFILRLPEGYQTIIGERGATLSGGERQRISIARALLKDAPILILDEPTSALDTETERSLLEALERLTRNRTTFIIAHRLSTIRRADRILVLKDGRIAESGTHAELLALRGIYARYHALQSAAPSETAATSS